MVVISTARNTTVLLRYQEFKERDFGKEEATIYTFQTENKLTLMPRHSNFPELLLVSNRICADAMALKRNFFPQ